MIKEADRLFSRCSGETDEKGVEVFENLAPEIVDGAMTFVGDDEVEGLDRNRGVVLNVACSLSAAAISKPDFSSRSSVSSSPRQHRVKPLDCGDGYAGDAIEPVRGEVLDVVNLGELTAVVRHHELLKFRVCLASEIGAIDKEEDVARASVLDEPIGERAGGECLAGAGRHLDERARFRLGEGLFEAGDCFDTTRADAGPSYGCLNGISARRWRSVSGSSIHFASVSGR